MKIANKKLNAHLAIYVDVTEINRMKIRKVMIEILFVSIAGLITVGLSISSIIENRNHKNKLSNKQKELDSAQNQMIDKQNLLIDLQSELQYKTNEIVSLQKQLQDISQQQLIGIERIKNPIPEELNLFFSSTLEMYQEEINQILDVINQNNFNNIPSLPFNSKVTNKGFEKINSFKRIMLYVNIILEKDGKAMSIKYKQGPLKFVGYHTYDYKNSFLSIFKEDTHEIIFSGNWLYINNISTNFKSPSILDFENSNVQITFEFLYPQGDAFIGDKPNYVVLNLKEMSFRHKNYSIEIFDIKKFGMNKFTGKCLIK